jgi:ABC-type nickel/cobalt efflux system permease component RcnA
MSPRRIFSFNFLVALALTVLGIADVVYISFYASDARWWTYAGAILTLVVGAFWLYSELSSDKPTQQS